MPRGTWTGFQPGVVAAMLVAEALQSFGVGMLPEAARGGFQEPLDHGSLGPGIILTKKIAGALIEEISVGQALIHPIFHHLGRGVVAEEIIDRGGHLHSPLIAVPHYALEPARVDHPRAEHAAGFFM